MGAHQVSGARTGAMKRDFITIDDLGDAALVELMDLADRIRGNLRGHAADLPGHVMGSLFLEPSTRTRLSFETSMQRLGGRVVTSSDPDTSSTVKGETLADTVRIVDSYVDVLVLRHPLSGAARLAARLAKGPVINAGDGSHEHPSQTLCDLYTLRCERGPVAGQTVVLYGDLRFGRTVHSLSRALVRFGATVLAIPDGDLTLPPFVMTDLAERPGYGVREVVINDMESIFKRRGVRATLIAPRAALPPLQEGPSALELAGHRVSAIYVTRLQKERLAGGGGGGTLPILDHRFLMSPTFNESIVLHPLPRVTEIARELDSDPRAAYFRQAALGVPIRMALLLWCCGLVDLPRDVGRKIDAGEPVEGTCGNANCISTREAPEWARVVKKSAGGTSCDYCEEPARIV